MRYDMRVDGMVTMKSLSALPLLFFAGMVWTHWRKRKFGEIFWMCHVSNLLLAVGMFFEQPLLIRAAAPWLVIGTPLWVMDMLLSRSLIPVSVVSHLGGTVVGLIALKMIGPGPSMWLASFIFYLVMQPISHWLTTRELNVNLAHRIYDPMEKYFPNFIVFWITATGVTALALWITTYLVNSVLY